MVMLMVVIMVMVVGKVFKGAALVQLVPPLLLDQLQDQDLDLELVLGLE